MDREHVLAHREADVDLRAHILEWGNDLAVRESEVARSEAVVAAREQAVSALPVRTPPPLNPNANPNPTSRTLKRWYEAVFVMVIVCFIAFSSLFCGV